MTNSMHAALQAAMDFHRRADDTTDDEVIETARKFYRELFVTAPGAAEDWDEGWFNRVHVWLRTLSGDQLGSVAGALKNVTSEREMMARGAMQDWPNVEGPLPTSPVPSWSEVMQKGAGRGPAAANRVPLPEEPPTTGRMQMASIPLMQVARHQPYPEPQVYAGPSATELLAKLNQVPYRNPGTGTAMSPNTDPLDVLPQLGVDTQHAGQVRAAMTAPAPPPIGPVLAPGQELRIRPLGADPFTTATVVAKLEHDNAEGFRAFVPPGAFSEAAKRELGQESVDSLLKALAPAGIRGTVVQQIKQLVDTVQSLRDRTKMLEGAQKNVETELREILGALPSYEGDEDWVPEETSIAAAKRVMKELSVARAKLRDLESE